MQYHNIIAATAYTILIMIRAIVDMLDGAKYLWQK